MKFNLNTRDLINVGVFTVIYFVVLFGAGMLGVFSPPFMFVGWAISILLNGIVVILFLARTPKMGALTLMGLLVGLLMMLTGHPWFLPIAGLILGFLGDLVATDLGKSSNPEPKRLILGYGIFSMWYVVPLLPILYNTDAYYEGIAEQMNPEYAQGMRELFTTPVLLVWAVCIFVLALIGGWIGVKAASKHFRRAGLAN